MKNKIHPADKKIICHRVRYLNERRRDVAKAMKVSMAVISMALSGCAWQPNGWNGTIYTDPRFHVQTYAVGISGAIPPWPWWKKQN
ncbi:MAG TPA: hypothetical protein VK742_20475 [Candidatus Sulfotelmatobacter sp.]|jgi:hypothetical protein|nr:hypothetical protein [Candidatus Sulfotelmatobacter sp.]